jgi:spore coat protein U-like protein
MRIQLKQKLFRILTLSILMLCVEKSYAACSISSNNFAFGAYNPLSGGIKTSSANIGISCTATTNVTLQLSPGNSGNFASRYMLKGSEQMNYNIYLDVGMNSIFGDGSSGTSQYTGVAGTSPTNVTIYGKIPAGQNISVGQYNDTINIQIFF